ncbi:MAG: hypothetical protein SF069_18795 [Phycisphaerae bacterium]|nr:hypothetical protein [Phycisphaerae bacterium]
MRKRLGCIFVIATLSAIAEAARIRWSTFLPTQTFGGGGYRLAGSIGPPFAEGESTAGGFGGGAGFWWVRVGQEPGEIVGDMNCDGFVTVGDISGFVLALTDPAQYATTYPDCDIQNADVNGDGFVTVGDIAAFVALLTGG